MDKLPHIFQETYRGYRGGCAVCGFGPGAFIHNSFEVARFTRELECFEWFLERTY